MADFSLSVAAFAEKAKMTHLKALRGTSIKLFSAVITSSPVDTGRFRANWTASGSTPFSGVSELTDKTGLSTIDSITKYINVAPNYEFTLSNNLPYAHVIEFGGYPDGPKTSGGYSKQAPSGCVRVNIARFEIMLNEAVREAK